MNATEFLMQLVKNNTGVSSKSFALVIGIIVGSLAIISFLVILFVDLFSDYQINTDLFGLAGIISAIATLISLLYWGKVRSERNDYNKLSSNNDKFPES